MYGVLAATKGSCVCVGVVLMFELALDSNSRERERRETRDLNPIEKSIQRSIPKPGPSNWWLKSFFLLPLSFKVVSTLVILL